MYMYFQVEVQMYIGKELYKYDLICLFVDGSGGEGDVCHGQTAGFLR